MTWSDVKLAEALDDRASYRRLCGFSADEARAEVTAFVRFRRRLIDRSLDKTLLDKVTRHIGKGNYGQDGHSCRRNGHRPGESRGRRSRLAKHAYRDMESAYRIGLKSLARRHLELHDEIADLDAMISAIVDELAPNLVDAVRGYEIDAEAAKPCNDPLSDLDVPRASSSGLACGPALRSGRLGLCPAAEILQGNQRTS